MDYRLIWSPQAIEDIIAIAEYIGRDSNISLLLYHFKQIPYILSQSPPIESIL